MLKFMKPHAIWSLLLLAACVSVQAQSGTLSAGGDGTGSGGTVSYSVGLVAYETSGGSSGSVAAGLQHAQVSVITGSDHKEIALLAEVHPNPAADYLKLSVTEKNMTGYSYSLLDLNGVLLEQHPLLQSETTISLKDINSGTFILSVLKNNQEIKTFKIIKNL